MGNLRAALQPPLILNVLFLSSWFPCPANNGSKLRAFYLLRALAAQHQVSVLSFVDEADVAPDVALLNELGDLLGVIPVVYFNPNRARAKMAFFSPLPRSQVDTFSREMNERARSAMTETRFDVVVASEMHCAEYALQTGRIPTVLDEVQVGVYRDAAMTGKVRPWLTWLKMKSYVSRLTRRFCALTTSSRVELAHLKQIAPRAQNFHLVPNGVDTRVLRPAQNPSAGKTVIYNGALTFGANLDAMRFFVGQIWPQIKAQSPDAKLKITGGFSGVDVAFCNAPDVELTGYVEDVAAHVRSAQVCVVPLRIGGGTRLKILEAMALGTPVVATSKGAQGLDVTNGQNILIADTPTDFAFQVLRLLSYQWLGDGISRSARALVEEKYDWARIGERFAALVESVV